MNQAQRQYRKEFARILRLKVSLKVKLEMLASFQEVLRQHIHIQSLVFNQSFTEISMVCNQSTTTLTKPMCESTKFSQSLSIDNVTMISQNDISQLEELILSKKIVKIENYEQIETLEEEFYAMEDAIECKRRYNEHLRKEIERKMAVIEEEKERSMVVGGRSVSVECKKSKHNKSFSDYLMSWWH